ncbi:hypothetical protein V8F33_014171 [Rhypophila sp. PSN 637]
MSTPCEPLQGNTDFYRLRIRIGVYLQWASAWLGLLLGADSAQAILDANSAFVFAVAIATIITTKRDAPLIEVYIMLQILIGFHDTILSTFGIRIWFMDPGRLNELWRQARNLWLEN